MKFLDKRTNTVKTAYSIRPGKKRVYIKFKEAGKEYGFHPEHIEILDEPNAVSIPKDSHIIYTFNRQCYKCKQDTAIYTYMVFDDGTNEDVIFPWNKERLLQNQNIRLHLLDPDIEYYGLKTIGSDEALDQLLAKKFPEKIKVRHSETQQRNYPMNICQHCGAKQGEYYVSRRVNEIIAHMKPLDIAGEIMSPD